MSIVASGMKFLLPQAFFYRQYAHYIDFEYNRSDHGLIWNRSLLGGYSTVSESVCK